MSSPVTRLATDSPVIRLNAEDDVVIARTQLIGGSYLDAEQVRVSGLIPAGHKVATRDIAEGEAVRRYGQIIGFASKAIKRGEHVHTHNLAMGDFARDYAYSQDSKPAVPENDARTFEGIVRSDGSVATRNYIGILTSVNCSATVARAIAEKFRRDIYPEAMADYPNVDGVVALTHGIGCAVDPEGEGLAMLQRTISGYARHPNFSAVLIIGLGCETNQIPLILESQNLQVSDSLRTFTLQESGGTSKSIELGVALVTSMLKQANLVKRQPVPLSKLVVGLQCGGSDGYSGMSANPALGVAVDLLVSHGGTAILSETPEIFGAEHLLTRRAVSEQVGKKLVDRILWWEDYCARNFATLNNNPSSGNKAGGLTTVLEKSLGGISKAGTSNLNEVYEYAEQIRERGLVFMDTPGYDPISATGQVAGGANLICFTTGRGSAFGCAPTPSLKIASNDALWNRQQDDMDFNCGAIISGRETVADMGVQLFELMIDVASGKRTRSELHGYGYNEFVPWQIGPIT